MSKPKARDGNEFALMGRVRLMPNVADQVGRFWVVTLPTDLSELNDILFETDLLGIMRQTLGGLKEEDIAGIYCDHDTALACACKLLVNRIAPEASEPSKI